MNKPQEWDNTQAFTGDFRNIVPGGYICKIKQAKVDTTGTGKEVLILIFDIHEGEYKDFYSEQYAKKKESNSDAKWQGTYRQLTEGTSLKFFKGVITAIEESNNGYKWNWDEKSLKDKLFGGLFGQEEYRGNDGSKKISTKCMQIRSVKAVRDGIDPPAIKKLKDDTSTTSSYDGFQEIDDDDIPF